MPTIPLKDYIYLGAILVLLIAFGVYTHHERSVGAAKVTAADAKVEEAQQQRNQALQDRTALATAINNGVYDREIQVPVHDAPVPSGLCHSADRGPVPAAAASNSGRDNTAVSGEQDASAASEIQRLTDFADAAVEIARDSDAQVKALQADLQTLRTEMEQTNVH